MTSCEREREAEAPQHQNAEQVGRVCEIQAGRDGCECLGQVNDAGAEIWQLLDVAGAVLGVCQPMKHHETQ